MKKFTFHLIQTDSLSFEEKDHVILADSLEDAIRKFERKHDVEAPAYWDEPSFDTSIEVAFKDKEGKIVYLITW